MLLGLTQSCPQYICSEHHLLDVISKGTIHAVQECHQNNVPHVLHMNHSLDLTLRNPLWLLFLYVNGCA